MLNFPNAKINLGLRILNKREDGFHNIESVFYPVNYSDALEIIPSEKFSFQSNNNSFSKEAWDNLCVKAYELLRVDFELPPAIFFLYKSIPVGAGLGGGSADAAFALKMLNQIFNLELSDNKLESYAAQLGSDCVFFIKNKAALVTGRGEELKSIDIDLSNYSIVIATPAITINTAAAYKLWDELMGHVKSERKTPLNEIVTQPVSKWKEQLENDFETVIFNQYPSLKSVKEKLYDEGAIYASLSGSGSSLYGIFEKGDINVSNAEKACIKFDQNVTLFWVNN